MRIDGMVSQPIWIATVIGVFFVGIGVSYAYFANTYDPMSMKFQNQELFNQMMFNNPKMSQQWMDSDMMNQQQMMNDSQIRQQIFNQMMKDPDQMMNWMAKDPKHIEQMSKIMKEDHEFMSHMMFSMMNDPELRFQMMGHMSENPEALKQMMNMVGMNNSMMMGNSMMGSGMMGMQIQGQTENKQTQPISSLYVEMVDGIQVVTVTAKEFTFTPSEIHINTGNTKFIMINNGIGEHEMVVYEASKKEIVDKAELAEDEATIEQNILFEIEEVHPGESGESEILNLKEGSYVIGCHIAGHYAAGMKGTLIIE